MVALLLNLVTPKRADDWLEALRLLRSYALDTVDTVQGTPPPGGGGGRLGSKFARMCVSKSEGHGFFLGFKGVK